MPGFIRRLVARIRYRGFDDELRREIEVHRAMLEDAAKQIGATPDEARHRAARQLGNVTGAREDARGIWIAAWIDSVWQDVRHGVRGLRKAPSFTLPAFIVLVLTMGVATSLYGAVESLLFRPWPLPEPDQVVQVSVRQRMDNGITVGAASVAEFEYWRDHAKSVALVATTSQSVRLGDSQALQSEPAPVRLVSGDYFRVLQIPLAAGRALGSDGAPTEMVISHELWQRQFGAGTNAVGDVIPVNGIPFTIVGIAAPGARDSSGSLASAWIPLSAMRISAFASVDEPSQFFQDPRGCCVQIAGRLAPDATHRQADAEIAALAARFAEAHGVEPAVASVWGTAGIDRQGAAQAIALGSLGSAAVLLTLLLGCANVGNLQLARGIARRREFDVRRALGATRLRIVRQLLVEVLLLAVAAAAVSVWLASTVTPALMMQVEPDVATLLTVDGRTVLFATALAVAVCLASGALPALNATRIGVGGHLVTAGPSRLQSSLLALQVGASIVLLIGAGLLARGIHHAAGARLGFNPHGLVAVSFGFPTDKYGPAEREQLQSALYERAADAGIGPLAGAQYSPFTAHLASNGVRLPDADAAAGRRTVVHQVTPGYFEILAIPAVSGRLVDEHTAPNDVVVNEALARRLWPGQSALGRVFLDDRTKDEAAQLGAEGGEKRVIGVVADARSEVFEMKWPAYYERALAPRVLLVRDDPQQIAALRALMLAMAPSATPRVTSLVSGLRAQLSEAIVGTAAAAAIALLALALATTGTLGVFSYVVSERTKEIGVRMTLGAGAREIFGMLASRLSRPLLAGAAVGLLAAQALGAVLGEYLYGISPRDPLAYVLVLVVLLLASATATFVPARRALRLDPAVTLRAE